MPKPRKIKNLNVLIIMVQSWIGGVRLNSTDVVRDEEWEEDVRPYLQTVRDLFDSTGSK